MLLLLFFSIEFELFQLTSNFVDLMDYTDHSGLVTEDLVLDGKCNLFILLEETRVDLIQSSHLKKGLA